MRFIKNYVVGGLLMIWNLPRILLSSFLILLPGALVGGLIYLVSPIGGDGTVAGVIALLVTLYVCTETPYRVLLKKVWPDASFTEYE